MEVLSIFLSSTTLLLSDIQQTITIIVNPSQELYNDKNHPDETSLYIFPE